jgi:hypothetical protein
MTEGAKEARRAELPVDPQPTYREAEATRVWLAKRGVSVGVPTRLLALRIGARRSTTGWNAVFRFVLPVLVGIVGTIAYQCLEYLPGVRGVEMTESSSLYFVYIGILLGMLLAVRRRDRLVRWAARPAVSYRPRILGGWYIASAVITFAGGAALGVTMYVSTPARTYAWSWLGVLALAAVFFAVAVTKILRAPALAEDDASLAVDAALRTEDSYLAMPAVFAVPVLFDLLTSNRQPHEFTGWLVVYVALALGTQAIGVLVQWRHRALPPGYYGSPVEAPAAVG